MMGKCHTQFIEKTSPAMPDSLTWAALPKKLGLAVIISCAIDTKRGPNAH
jgi:hypothetical protein